MISVTGTTASAGVCDSGAFTPRLGFSSWPTDFSFEGVDRAYAFIAENADIILQHLDAGVPWDPALARQAYPQKLLVEWQTRVDKTPDDMPIFLALTPLNFGRDGLAADWTDAGEQQPLNADWSGRSFDDPAVIAAFTHYALSAVDQFDPAYLAIGIEANILITKDPSAWPAYLTLNAAVYDAVKAAHPDLTVFTSIQYEYLRGIGDDSKPNLDMQQPGVAALMEHSDLMALSTYRFGTFHPNPMGPEFFDIALSFGKPVAIAESGATSRSFMMGLFPMPSSESRQLDFVSGLLQGAQEHDMPFLINWVNVDYDGLLEHFPSELYDFGKVWVSTGLETYDGDPKPALEIWRRCLGR